MSNIIKLLPKKKKTKIGVLIQARMTSKRFPGKVLHNLWGKPVLQHVIERAGQIRGGKDQNPEVLAVIVPDTDESEPILELATKLGVTNFCGSENNVLERYYHAAIHFHLDVIVRITADCVVLNPRVSSEVLQLLLWRKLDYVSNVHPKRTYPAGLDTECFTMDCLEAAYKLAETDYDKEHVTPWMQREDRLQKACVTQAKNKSHQNWCVDYLEDIARLESMMIATPKILVSV